jgi:hypothetical protein
MRIKLITGLKVATDEYAEIKPRDLADLVHGISNFYIASDDKTKTFCKKQLKILAKRSALKMPKMSQKSREVVREAYSVIDLYDPDLTVAMKKHNLL